MRVSGFPVGKNYPAILFENLNRLPINSKKALNPNKFGPFSKEL